MHFNLPNTCMAEQDYLLTYHRNKQQTCSRTPLEMSSVNWNTLNTPQVSLVMYLLRLMTLPWRAYFVWHSETKEGGTHALQHLKSTRHKMQRNGIRQGAMLVANFIIEEKNGGLMVAVKYLWFDLEKGFLRFYFFIFRTQCTIFYMHQY